MHIEASSRVIFKIIQVLIYKNSNDLETNKSEDLPLQARSFEGMTRRNSHTHQARWSAMA